MVKFAHWLLAGWHVGKIIGWLLLSCGIAAAGDERRPTSGTRLEPIPQTEPLPPAPTGRAEPVEPVEQDAHAPVGLRDWRPVIECWTVNPRICPPCGEFKAWLKAESDGGPFRFIVYESEGFEQLPAWVRELGVPMFRYDGKNDGKFRPRQAGWHGLKYLLDEWHLANPEQTFAASQFQGPGKSLVEQALQFLPVGSRINIESNKPVTVRFDDGASVSYSRIQGRVTTLNGQPAITFDPPLPRAEVRRWGLKVGLDVRDVAFEPPATASVGTAMGRYRIKLEEVRK